MNLSEHIDRSGYGDLLRKVGSVAEGLGLHAFAVGGFVRDLLLRRETTDIDIVTEGLGSGIDLARGVAQALGGTTAHEYARFGTAAIRVDDKRSTVLEFVAARKESYAADSRNPEVETGTLEEDQARRDFTVNALSVSLSPIDFGVLVDPFDGLGDLQVQTLRTPAPPDTTFVDDPLRIFRGARFAAQLGFDIARETFEAMRNSSERVEMLAMERITAEINKILLSAIPSIGFKILFDADVLHRVLPELTALRGVETRNGVAHKDNFYHTLQVVDNLSTGLRESGSERYPAVEDTLWVRWAALLHDIGKPRSKRFSRSGGWTFHGHEEIGARMVRSIFKRMRLPLDERMGYVEGLVRMHHRPVALVDDSVTDSAVRRLLFDAGDAIDDLMLLVRADITSKNDKRVRRYLRAFDSVEQKFTDVEEKDRLRNFQPPVDGKEIMERLGLAPSRLVGDLKEAIREAILNGEIPNEHDAALDYLMKVKDEIVERYSS